MVFHAFDYNQILIDNLKGNTRYILQNNNNELFLRKVLCDIKRIWQNYLYLIFTICYEIKNQLNEIDKNNYTNNIH